MSRLTGLPFPLCARLGLLSKVNNMVTLTSVNNLQASLATAQRKVEQGQNQVQRDSEQLAQSRQSLAREQETLSRTQRSSRQAQDSDTRIVKAPQLDQAIKVAIPQQLSQAAPKSAPQLNSYGQSLGRLINVTA
ncbi:multidrug resistance efflux pump [Janthinobacterium sp. CAN_S7]